MKSGLRRLIAAAGPSTTPPVPLTAQNIRNRGLTFDLGVGRHSADSQLKTYHRSGTLFSIVSLLSQGAASIHWSLFQKAPRDGRRRYSKGGDQGSDQRREVVQHAALSLWNQPNAFYTGFEFREACNQHLELTGMTVWILERQGTSFPTSMWFVRPDRMEAIPSTDEFIAGWMYHGPNGESIPLKNEEVIIERLPDPDDPFRGASPVSAIMPNIQQQDYATQYQRNLFLNNANPGGILIAPNELTEREFDELTSRWRETHQGVARAGRVAVLENGITWQPSAINNRDLEYGALRLANRDEIREAFRIHPQMLGTVQDVNRANAVTAQEIHVQEQVIPRLERRKMTLNCKLLPMFGASGEGVEFDYEDPTPENTENLALELHEKAQAAQLLINAGLDPHDVLETVGLPDMNVLEQSVSSPAIPPGWVPASPATPGGQPVPPPAAREIIRLVAQQQDAAAQAYQQQCEDYPVGALAWMHHASWSGPVKVPLTHINPTMNWMDEPDPEHVADFTKRLEKGKKLKPVLLVKLPGRKKLKLVDGHHRYLAAAQLGKPVRAYIGTVDADHGDWEQMHSRQFGREPGKGGGGDNLTLGQVMLAGMRPYTARALPAAALNRRRS